MRRHIHQEVNQIKALAIANWTNAGLTVEQLSRLTSSTIEIGNLDDEGALGLTGSSRIVLDDDALGYGWYVGSMSETVPERTIDLLTVLTHEMGHVLGLSDLDGQATPDSLMAGTLQPGQRRAVNASDLQSPGESVGGGDLIAPTGVAAPIDGRDMLSRGDRIEAHSINGVTVVDGGQDSGWARLISADWIRQLSGDDQAAPVVTLQPVVKVKAQRSLTQQESFGQTVAGSVGTHEDLQLLDSLFTDSIQALSDLA